MTLHFSISMYHCLKKSTDVVVQCVLWQLDLQLVLSFPTNSDPSPPISLGISLAGASAAVSFARIILATSATTLTVAVSCIDMVDNVRSIRDPSSDSPPAALVVR